MAEFIVTLHTTAGFREVRVDVPDAEKALDTAEGYADAQGWTLRKSTEVETREAWEKWTLTAGSMVPLV